jgi:hypothetical protein
VTRVWGVLVGVVLLAACGNATTLEPVAVPTSAVTGVDSVVSEPPTTVYVESNEPPDSSQQSITTPPPEVETTVLAPPPPMTTLFPGDVSPDDPLPPQADAASEPAVAEVALRYALTHWILVDLDPALRSHLVENGENDGGRQMDERIQANRGLIGCARLDVDVVQFTDPEHAIVKFWVNCGQSRSSYFPTELTGGGIFQNGSWRIAGRTLCVMAFAAALDCNRLNPANPAPATGFHAAVIPDGYTRLDMSGDAIATDSTAQWQAPNGQDFMTIDVQSMAGVSALESGDISFVLDSRLGVSGGTDVDIDGRPGRVVNGSSGGYPGPSLTFVRADDIVITIRGSRQATADELVAIALGLVPLTPDEVPPTTALIQVPMGTTVQGPVTTVAFPPSNGSVPGH